MLSAVEILKDGGPWVNSGNVNKLNINSKYSANLDGMELTALLLAYSDKWHSNDVRGRTITIDPINGNKITPVDLFVNQIGCEVGSRFEKDDGSNLSLTIYFYHQTQN